MELRKAITDNGPSGTQRREGVRKKERERKKVKRNCKGWGRKSKKERSLSKRDTNVQGGH